LPRLINSTCIVSTLFNHGGALSVLANTTLNPQVASYVLDTLVPALVDMLPQEFARIFEILQEESSMSFIYWSVATRLPHLLVTDNAAELLALVLYDTIVHLAGSEQVIEEVVRILINNLASLLDSQVEPNQGMDLVMLVVAHLVPMLLANDEVMDVVITTIIINAPAVLAVSELRELLFDWIDSEIQTFLTDNNINDMLRSLLSTGDPVIDGLLWDMFLGRVDYHQTVKTLVASIVTFDNFEFVIDFISNQLAITTEGITTTITIDKLIELFVARMTSEELITSGVDFISDKVNNLIDTITSRLLTFVQDGRMIEVYQLVMRGAAAFLGVEYVQSIVSGFISAAAPGLVLDLIESLDVAEMVIDLIDSLELEGELATILDLALEIIDIESFINTAMNDIKHYIAGVFIADNQKVSTFVALVFADLNDIATMQSLNEMANGLVHSVINALNEVGIINDIIEIVFDNVVAELRSIISNDRLGELIDAVIAIFIGDVGEQIDWLVDFLQVLTINVQGDRFLIGGIDTLLGELDVLPANIFNQVNDMLNMILNRVVSRVNPDGRVDLYILSQGNYTPFMDMIFPVINLALGATLGINANEMVDSGLFGMRVIYDQISQEIAIIASLNITNLADLTPIFDAFDFSLPFNLDIDFNFNMDITVNFSAGGNV